MDENDQVGTMDQERLKEIVGLYDAVIVGLETWDLELFSLAKHLKLIARFGAGLDNIDLHAAKEAHVRVSNAGGMNASSVANMVVGLTLNCLRRITMFDRAIRHGEWPEIISSDLDGKSVGLLGFGNVARNVALRMSGFSVRLFAYDMYPDHDAAMNLGVTLTDIDTIYRECDVISLHLPYTEGTHHMINSDTFRKMKPNAILINTARGRIVDTDALCTAVRNGIIAGAGIDVFEEEPLPSDSQLLLHPSILLTPIQQVIPGKVVKKSGCKTQRISSSFLTANSKTTVH